MTFVKLYLKTFYFLKNIGILIRMHVVDCVQQVFQQSFDHVDNLEALRIKYDVNPSKV